MTKIKKSIVFCHGIWADGSCFNKVIPALQDEGFEVMSAQYGLDTNEGDVAAVKRTLARVSSPTILVGHSAQFIRICRWLQLIHKDRLAPLENAPFSTLWARQRYRVAQCFR